LRGLVGFLLVRILLAPPAAAQTQGPVRITLDEAIQMALQHNHNILAARTTIQQSQAEEITANLRPNPTLFADWEYLPLGSPSHQNPNLYPNVPTNDYLNNNTEGDIGLSYLIERGKKRQHRLQPAKNRTRSAPQVRGRNGRAHRLFKFLVTIRDDLPGSAYGKVSSSENCRCWTASARSKPGCNHELHL
jgi:hypothetical protein